MEPYLSIPNIPKRLGTPRVTGIEARKETVGERIRERQRITRATNEELASAADVHVKTVSQWRHDRQMPTDDNLSAIAPVLKTTFLYLKNGFEGGVTTASDPDYSRLRNFAVHEGFRLYHTPPLSRLPARAKTLVAEYMNKLIDAGLRYEELDEAESFLINGAFNKINAREPGEKTEEDFLLDIQAAWEFVREVVNRNGKKV